MTKQLEEASAALNNLAEKLCWMFPDIRADLERRLAEARVRNHRRLAKVAECHPGGEHWPPHRGCPACQKVAEMRYRQAQGDRRDEAA